MKVSQAEREAIRLVLECGKAHGYGNLISHLQTAWAARLMESGVSEAAARVASRGPGYPFQMQQDIIERGEWDETGERYRKRRGAHRDAPDDTVKNGMRRRPRPEGKEG